MHFTKRYLLKPQHLKDHWKYDNTTSIPQILKNSESHNKQTSAASHIKHRCHHHQWHQATSQARHGNVRSNLRNIQHTKELHTASHDSHCQSKWQTPREHWVNTALVTMAGSESRWQDTPKNTHKQSSSNPPANHTTPRWTKTNQWALQGSVSRVLSFQSTSPLSLALPTAAPAEQDQTGAAVHNKQHRASFTCVETITNTNTH